MIRLGNNKVLKTLTKTLIFVDADSNANADAGGSTIALPERCSGELKTKQARVVFLFYDTSSQCHACTCKVSKIYSIRLGVMAQKWDGRTYVRDGQG